MNINKRWKFEWLAGHIIPIKLGIDLYTPIWGGVLLCSEVDKPSEFFIKTSNAEEYIEWDIQKIEAPRIENHII